jgi:hypothetical protein
MLHQPPESFNVSSLLSIHHKQQIFDDFHERLSQKKFGGEADQAESENEEQQKKDDCAEFRLHNGQPPRKARRFYQHRSGECQRPGSAKV